MCQSLYDRDEHALSDRLLAGLSQLVSSIRQNTGFRITRHCLVSPLESNKGISLHHHILYNGFAYQRKFLLSCIFCVVSIFYVYVYFSMILQNNINRKSVVVVVFFLLLLFYFFFFFLLLFIC